MASTVQPWRQQFLLTPEVNQVLNVKKQIEQSQGAQTYSSEQQLLIYQGKVLRDETTIEENKISENTFLVIMLSKLRAQKPTWETGSSFSLKNKAVQKQERLLKSDPLGVKLDMNDDLEDLIDEESLLSEEDSKRSSLPSANDYEVSTKRKACKNCTCGQAEFEEKQTKLGLTAEQLNNPQFACGNVLPPAVPFKKAADNTSPRLSKNPVFSNHQKLAGRRGSPNGIKPPFSSPGMPPSSRIPNKLLPVSNVCADTSFKGNGETGVKGFMPMPGGNEYTRPSFQRGVRSLHPQGGPNPYLSSYGHRPNNIHEQRRLNYDWNSQQALYGTDNTAMYQRVGPRNRPLPPLIPPNYGLANNPGFHAIPTLYFPPRTHLDSVRGGPYFVQPPPPGVFVSAPDPQLCASIVKQIEYYFSVVNLCKDPFLRMNMDGQGWVPISLIAGFNLIKALTSDINLILFALRSSSVVEVKADKIRRRGDWSKWVLPAGVIKSTSRTQPQDTCINVNTGNVENDAKLEGQTSVSSRHLIGSPLTENGVPSGVSSELERTSDHGISKRTFPEGDIINGILDIRINETV